MEGILFLSIPIIAIIVWSPIGRALADYISKRDSASLNVKQLLSRVEQLETSLAFQQEEVSKLKDSVLFYEELQAPETSSKQLFDKS